MADGLHMGNLSLNDSQHAPQAPAAPPGRAAYIPPHLRQRNVSSNMDNSAPPPGPGYGAPRYSVHSSRVLSGRPLTPSCYGRNGPRGGNWANANAPDFSPRGPANGKPSWNPNVETRPFDPHAYGHPSFAAGYGGSSGGGYGGSPRGSGDGQWRDGKHIPGPSNARVERELFGVPNDPSKQHTGINFSNYDDIPVEASGMYIYISTIRVESCVAASSF